MAMRSTQSYVRKTLEGGSYNSLSLILKQG